MNEDKPRKLVYVEKHTEPDPVFDGNMVWYECPECGQRFDWLGRNRGGAGKRFCPGCGNWLSWAKLDYENYKESDSSFDKEMPFWKFLQDPRYGHSWEDEVSMTYSHSEIDIFNGCIQLMQGLVDEFQEYCEWMGWEPESEEERFCLSMPYLEIVRTLFLSHTTHDGGTSTGMKCKNLGIKKHSITFEFRKEDEEDEGE